MPIATPDVYAAMLDAAKAGSFAYPAINISSSQTLNAALQASPRRDPTASSRSPPAAASTPPGRRSRTW